MSRLTHLDAQGAARMVDVSGKPLTRREGIAEGFIAIAAPAQQPIQRGEHALATVALAAMVGHEQPNAFLVALQRAGHRSLHQCPAGGATVVDDAFTWAGRPCTLAGNGLSLVR